MRSARAFLASLGASTCLILAGTLAMTSLSALVAFNGLPGLGGVRVERDAATLRAAAPVDRSGVERAVTMLPPVVPASAEPTLAEIVRSAPSRASRTVRRVADGGRTDRPGRTTSVLGLSATVTTLQPELTLTPPAASKPATGSPARSDRPTDPVREVGGTLGGAIATTGGVVAGAAQPVAPALAPTVADATAAAGGVVQGVTDVVATVVDGLTGVIVP